MLSFCLLFSTRGKKNDQNIGRANMLLSSLARHSGAPSHVYIVTPEAQLPVAEECLVRSPDLTYTYITDEEVIPDCRSYADVNSWYRQQVLKLLVHRFIDTEFYLLLDCDVICCRDFTEASFIRENRSYLTYGKAGDCFDWPEGSSLVLGIPRVAPETLIMTVTPNIFAKEIVRSLLACISQRFSMPAEAFLLRNTHCHWSEYTLYYLYAMTSGMADRFHIPFQEYAPNHILSAHSLWDASTYEDLDRLETDAIVAEGSYFLVVQSLCRFSIHDIGRKFSRFIT